MPLPRAIVGFNKAINNPIQRQYAWLLPPWAIVNVFGFEVTVKPGVPTTSLKAGEVDVA